jgi:hypothetical protein
MMLVSATGSIIFTLSLKYIKNPTLISVIVLIWYLSFIACLTYTSYNFRIVDCEKENTSEEYRE